jgi:basic amino acid/polyamine antiporter, APA family
MGLLTTKPVAVLEAEAEVAGDSAGGLRRVLGPADLTLLGVGAIVGLGGVALTGYLASNVAGPAVTLSFALAALACLLAALCFAELASVVPSAGGPYAYAYAALGELPAWMVAWCLLLEYVLGAAAVAVGWARYVGSLVRDLGAARVPEGAAVGALAALLVAALSLALLAGVRAAVRLNAALAVAKLVALVGVVVGGALTLDAGNWRPFVPPLDAAGRFGWPGVLHATSAVFFAYLGFDAVAAAAGEARRPRRDVPRAIVVSLLLSATLYVLVAATVTGARRFAPTARVDSIAAVLGTVGHAPWLVLAVRLGLGVGLAGVVLVLLLAAARVLHAMARDGLLPAAVGAVSPRSGVPRLATLVVGGLAAVASLAPVDELGDVVTAGALLAFVAVCASLIALRRRRPELARPFRVPAGQAVALLGAVVSFALLLDATRHRPAYVVVALFVGLVLYFAYPQAHSRAGRVAAVAE